MPYQMPKWAEPELEQKPCAICGRVSYYDLCPECEAYFQMFEKIALN